MKFLITGLGNIGQDYHGTRHNIGFRVVNKIAEDHNVTFSEQHYGAIVQLNVKNVQLTLLKPNTFMNLSGRAVRYWLQKENVSTEQLLVVVDDLALPFGTLRLKGKGSHAGHNGLRNIEELLETNNYPRLRFGIGKNFQPGKQFEYVLSKFTEEEEAQLPAFVEQAAEIVKGFCLEGIEKTMNKYN